MSESSTGALEARGLTRRFGGVVAVNDVTLTLTAGEVHGLIGPNGAGKSTLIALLSGYLRPGSGSVRLRGAEITRRNPSRIARLGLARTFQAATPLAGLSVRENFLVGLHTRYRASTVEVLLRLPRARRESRELGRKADELLERFGLEHVADSEAQSLPFGQLRFLDVARAVAREPDVLLLDEPAAGLNAAETEQLTELVGSLRAGGISIVLVDHDVPFVFGLSNTVTVMNFGRVIASGLPDDVYESAEVREAYLGSPATEAAQ